ncbi:MAG: nicotinate-nucleotide adenylyltransferase [Acidimicrobiales bacterium]
MARAGGEKRRIGLLGGTFDPPHLGHLVVGDQVRKAAGLDEVWFVVANDPWQKADREVTPAAVRLEMTEAAIAAAPGLSVSPIEIERGGTTYTIDTLETLRLRHPDVEWSVIVGRDAAAGLHTWHRADDLREAARFLVVDRPGSVAEVSAGFASSTVDVPELEISSSDIRRRVAAGESVRFLVPDAVVELVERHGLYRPGDYAPAQ